MQKFIRSFMPIDPLTPEELEKIHTKTVDLLKSRGVQVRCEQARAAFHAAGAQVKGEQVFFGDDLLQQSLRSVPRTFKMMGRNPESEVVLGTNECMASPIYGATHILDPQGRRRLATLSDVHRLHRAVQKAPELQNVGSNIVEPADIPPALRHLHILESLMTNTDKVFMAMSTSRDTAVSRLGLAQVRAEDSIAMARIALGSEFNGSPCMVGVATCNTALTWEAPSLGVIRTLAQAGQAIMVAPFSIAGSNAPEDMFSLFVQVNAEVLAGIAYTQLVRPGTPVLYGPYATTRDHATGNSMAGTPEICMYLLAFGQLARYYQTPYRGGGLVTGAKSCDYQAGAEGSTVLLTSLMAGSHFLFHTGGWLEGGLTVSPSKLQLDLEELRKAMQLHRGIDWSGTVPFFKPKFANYNSFDGWSNSGRPCAESLSNVNASTLLDDVAEEDSTLADDRREALREYVLVRERALAQG